MDRHGLDRALEFFRYSRVSAWGALACSLATSVLFVGTLVLLGLFFDLSVEQGKIPRLAQLPRHERERFVASLALPEEAGPRDEAIKDRVLALRELKINEPAIEKLVSTDPKKLSDGEREFLYDALWMINLPATMKRAVGPRAEEDVRSAIADNLQRFGPRAGFERDLDDFGILGLVVRSRDNYQGYFTHVIAQHADWTWRGGNLHYLQSLLFAAMALTLLRGILFVVGNRLAATAVVEAVTRLRRAIYLQTFRLGTLVFRSLGPSEAVGISTRNLESVHEGLYLWLTAYYREPVKFGLTVLFAFLVNFWLGVVLLVLATLVWVVAGQMASHYRGKAGAAEVETGEQIALLQESLLMMRLVKAYLMEPFNQSRFDTQMNAYANAQRARYASEAIYRGVFRVLAIFAGLVVLYLAGRLLIGGVLGVTSALIMAAALVSLYWPAVAWLDARKIMRRSRDSCQAMFEFLDRPGSVGQAVEAEFLPALAKSLEFENVHLKEPGTGRKLLRGVTFSIRAGQRVAIVGPEEMETHALVYLLSRFLDPTQGEIRIDKKNIRWVTLDSLRAQVATVLQNSLVFNDTVANNIACGDPSYNLARIIEAAKIAHAHQFITRLPKGYDTPIGDLNHALKIGEKYRIALARAILRDPALYVIEEPVGPLDDDTKAMIDDTMSRILPGHTVIFLPHRLSTLKSCDRVYFLYEGKIADQGGHRELLAANDLYRHLQYLEFNEFAGRHTASPASVPDIKI